MGMAEYDHRGFAEHSQETKLAKIDTTVGHLVDMIQRGELRLPEMQRRYVWTSTRVRDLLDSLYRGYPSGTILVWETDLERPTRDLAVAQDESPFATFKLLLDGQQRLTSLSAVIRGEPIRVKNRRREIDIAFNLDHPEGPPVDITEVEDDAENPAYSESDAPDDETEAEENGVGILDRLNKRVFAVASKQLLARPNWISVSQVFSQNTSDWAIIKALVQSPEAPKFDLYSRRLQRLRKIREYPYVMQVLDRELSYEEVAEIFVRVNSLGAKLRGSDLALAQITAKWQNSLHLLEEFSEKCEEESSFTLDLGLLVRAIVVFATNQSRFKTVGNISLARLQSSWERAKRGLEFAINFLRTNAGIEDESLLSSPALMIPIAVYGSTRSVIAPEDERYILRWLYVANARGHYSESSESTLDADLAILSRATTFEEMLGPLNQRFGRLHVEASDFKGRGERSALFALAYLALKHGGAKDWKTGLGLSLTHQGHLHYVEYHHIFPKSVLRHAGYEKSEINEIANMAFISGRSNRNISNKRPIDYLPAVIRERGEKALVSQGIGLDRELWEVGRYRDFLEARRQTLASSVNHFIDAAADHGHVVSAAPQ